MLRTWQSMPKVHLSRGPDGKTGPLQGLAGVGWLVVVVVRMARAPSRILEVNRLPPCLSVSTFLKIFRLAILSLLILILSKCLSFGFSKLPD